MNYSVIRFKILPSFVAIEIAILLAVSSIRADDPSDPPLRWWKGNIHTHSLWSDGNDFPEMIADWYKQRDYNFLALSDHNILSEGQRWMRLAEIEKRGGESALAKYQKRFGKSWVETRGEGESIEVRLKPLDEFRALLDTSGQFIMMTGEEISDSVEGKPVHMNATNLMHLIQPLGGSSVPEAISANLRAARDQADRNGREILVHLNHPNFGYGVTAQELASVIDEDYFEVYNGHPGVNHLGDDQHPAVEKIWDVVCTLRVFDLNADPIKGIATDDSHTYHGIKNVTPGRGWVMVRARYLTPESIIRAMNAGDFYASSGVELTDVRFDRKSGLIDINIQGEEGESFETQFIGSRIRKTQLKNPCARTTESSEFEVIEVGEVLATVKGVRPCYRLCGNELFVRACITSSKPHPNPSFKDQKQQAWTQPMGWQTHMQEKAGSAVRAPK